MEDDFDPDNFRLPPELAAVLTKAKPKRGNNKPPRRTEPFLQVPHKALVAGSAVLHSSKQFLVWLYVFHRVWADKSNTVTVANTTLNSWGVRRDQKTQALRLLEGAGLIAVQWRERRSPLVTLLTGR
jgi:hypothetical protein